MSFFQEAGVCDCHSHVFGPFAKFPLSDARTFEPPEAPVEALERVWHSLGISRAVLVQGSAHGDDPSAMVDAIQRSPETRRGVVLLSSGTSSERLKELDGQGIRAVRFNWIRHLLGKDARAQSERLADAATLIEKVNEFGWHVELHLEVDDLHLAEELPVPLGMPVVIDHMARINMAQCDAATEVARLLRLLEQERFWVKISGADRLAVTSETLLIAIDPLREVLKHASPRCVWGLDWPHVNLATKRSDLELAQVLLEAAADEDTLRKVLVTNAATLYGFEDAVAETRPKGIE